MIICPNNLNETYEDNSQELRAFINARAIIISLNLNKYIKPGLSLKASDQMLTELQEFFFDLIQKEARLSRNQALENAAQICEDRERQASEYCHRYCDEIDGIEEEFQYERHAQAISQDMKKQILSLKES